jgi:hypothetical protein
MSELEQIILGYFQSKGVIVPTEDVPAVKEPGTVILEINGQVIDEAITEEQYDDLIDTLEDEGAQVRVFRLDEEIN